MLSTEEKHLELGTALGLVSSVHMHPLHGPSVSVWVQALSLVVTLNPNSVVDVPLNSFASEGSLRRPTQDYDTFNSTHNIATCDIRDVSVIERKDWELLPKILLDGQNLHPADYFSQMIFRKSMRIPWLGVRVVVPNGCMDRRDWRGEVIDIGPDPENHKRFSILINWYHSFFGYQFEWCDYDKVRRVDNQGLLHEFTPYSGTSPWNRVKVKVIKQGPYKD